MSPKSPLPLCECCDSTGITRRSFLKTTVTSLAAASAGTLPLLASHESKLPEPNKATSETLVTTLYQSLTEAQRQSVVFPFDHPLRSKVDNNWHITKQRVGKDFTPDQQAMIREIFLKMHSPEYAERVMKQVEHDAGEEGWRLFDSLVWQTGNRQVRICTLGTACDAPLRWRFGRGCCLWRADLLWTRGFE